MAPASDRFHLLDGDPHDARLVDAVRPPRWESRAHADQYDLVVVGGGTAGLVSAMIAAALGARVALVERALLGGDCLVTGCVPSKALLRAGRAVAAVRDASAFGVSARVEAVDFAAVMERMRRLRSEIAANDAAERFARAGVDVLFGDARFVGRDALEVDGKTLRFSRAILATGSRAALPDIPGLAEAGCLTNETVFNLTVLPKRLVVIGGGPIGCELAQAFARFGSTVTIVQRQARLLPRDDADAARVVEAALVRDGVRLVLSASPERVERVGAGAVRRVHVRGDDGAREALECDAVLVAAGRAPNVEDMGLDAAGVAVGKEGVVVDDHLRTSNPRIFAAGDVASSWKFTHAADALARVAVQNALFPVRKRASSLVIPWCTYTDPEVAHVGAPTSGEAEASEELRITVPLERVDRAVLDSTDEGFARVRVERRSGRVRGATLVSAHAGESIATMTLAMTHGLSLGSVDAAIACYPTEAEVWRRVAGEWQRTRLKPWMPRVVRRWLALRR